MKSNRSGASTDLANALIVRSLNPRFWN
jgi:hypothetical protein